MDGRSPSAVAWLGSSFEVCHAYPRFARDGIRRRDEEDAPDARARPRERRLHAAFEIDEARTARAARRPTRRIRADRADRAVPRLLTAQIHAAAVRVGAAARSRLRR